MIVQRRVRYHPLVSFEVRQGDHGGQGRLEERGSESSRGDFGRRVKREAVCVSFRGKPFEKD